MTEDKKDTIVEPKTIGELENKMRLEGVVKTNEIFGVLVDVEGDCLENHEGYPVFRVYPVILFSLLRFRSYICIF